MSQLTPSTDWTEKIDPAEAARHQEFADQIVAIQTKINAKYGLGRAFHRKQVLGVAATVEVIAELPAALAQGFFAHPGTFAGLVRLSGGALVPQADALPDVRGFALSIRGLDSAGALGGRTDRQDFALINRPVFGFHDSTDFADFVPAGAKGQTALLKFFIAKYGPIGGPKEAARLTKDLLRPFSGFATERFFSAGPIKYGPYAVRVRLTPEESDKHLAAVLDFGNEMTKRLRAGEVRYKLEVQFFVDETQTPIEDGMIDWSADISPFHHVATVVLPVQDPASESGRELGGRIENDRFDPWAAFADHRPLGEIMRARKAAYYPSAMTRHATGT